MSELPVQSTFADLGTPLYGTTFVVVDLETTGGSADADAITEIGAVKIRRGEVLGEFQTLVRPATPIPAFISVLTGITDPMVSAAPSIASALPMFLEFAAGSVLVAHHAPFDLSFLRRNAERCGITWPAFTSLDTARIARRALTRDEAPNCKLATLSRLFRTETEPCHRALADARATVDVLHALLERVGNLGVNSVEELIDFSSRVPDAVRRRRFLADGLPAGPGVYLFRDAAGRALYVGKSMHVRNRVRSYFTGSETRKRMAEMVRIAECVDAIPCATGLEAEVRELRLVDELQPPYNRRSRRQHKQIWLTLTREPFPRLSLVHQAQHGDAVYLGPFGSRAAADQARTALHEAIPLRQCTARLPRRPHGSRCVLADLGRCGAPCVGGEDTEQYAEHVSLVTQAASNDISHVVATLQKRLDQLARLRRYEDAAAHRDRLIALLRAADRIQRLTALTRIEELIAARRHPHGWELTAIRHGRLVGASTAHRGDDPWPHVRALAATSETLLLPGSGDGPVPAASAEETECLLRWLESDDVRLVQLSTPWASPAFGAGRWRDRTRRWLTQ